MDKNKELIKNTIIIFIGRFCTQFISFLLVPIYTNFLSTSDYGYIDLVQNYLSLLVPILVLRLDSGIFRFLIDERDNNKGKKSIISTTIFFLAIQIIFFIVAFGIINLIFEINYTVAIMLNVIFMAISSILLQLTRGIGDNVGYSLASIIAGIVTIVLNIWFVIIWKMDGSSILIASAIANIFCSFFLVIRNKTYRYIKIKDVNKEQFKKMTRYSLPMIPDGLSWWVVNASDRSIISAVMGAGANGIYAVSSKFSNILSSLFQIFNMSWQESASLHINDKDKNEFFSNILNVTYKIFFSICIMIMVCMPFVFKLVIGNGYIEAYQYIPILLLGNLYNAMANVIGGVYIAKKKTKVVARTTMLAAIINIVMNLIMIRKFGLHAATISTLVAYVILTIYRYMDVQKYVKMKFKYKTVIITTVLFIISYLLYYHNQQELNMLNFLVTILVCMILNKDMIKKVLSKIRRKK